MNKIGLLLPRSTIYPSINFDLLNGIKWGAKNAGIQDLDLKMESIGVGGDDKIILSACEQLLFSDVKVVIAYINPTTAEKLQSLFANAGALLIALDAGYHFPLKADKLANVINISLEGALCCRITGNIATANGHNNIAYVTSFYDSGYRSAYTFVKAVSEAGGSITFNHITKLKRSEFTLDPLREHLVLPDTNGVMASFCGDMAADFCATSAATSIFNGQAVYGSPFMCDEYWLRQSPYPGTDIACTTTWASTLENAENKTFTETLASGKSNVNLFSLLGWEASIVLAHVLKTGDITTAIDTFEGYNGPRGAMVFNKTTNKVHAPVYRASVRKDEANGNCRAEITGIYDDVQAEREKITADIIEFAGQGTSWYNVYGCIDS